MQVSAVVRSFRGIEGGMGITRAVHLGLYHPVRVEDKIPDLIEAVDGHDCLQHQHEQSPSPHRR